MTRFYCPQVHSSVKGWIDLPMVASLKQKEAEGCAKELAEIHHRITRVIRKPHGWKPLWEDPPEPRRELPTLSYEPEPTPEERVALIRKHEKHQSRLRAMRPSAWVRILRDVLGEEEV